jgi:hypothetical protein
LLRRADIDDSAVVEHLERAEDPKLHVTNDANTVLRKTKGALCRGFTAHRLGA